MKVIYKIARLELLNLFYSPVAWLLLVLFVFMTGSEFGKSIEIFSKHQELEPWPLNAISQSIFENVLWRKVVNLFYMIMPLLTMGLISQEFNRGSIKLLFSAPISGRHIVLGKYLGVMLYGLLMVGILSIYVVISGLTVESFEWSAVLTGLLGLYLLFGVYAAIGLFMSSLTTYQIVSAIGMLALLTLLGLIRGIWQDYDFVREITYWLSISGRVDTFRVGMICSEDVLYFLILIGMFLGFAILRIQLYREVCSFSGKVLRYSAVFVVAMLLGYVSSRPAMKTYYDATYTKKNTLTQASQDIVSKLDGGLKMTTYVNLFGGGSHSINTSGVKQDMARYDKYVRFKPETKIDYVFYYYTDTMSTTFKRRYPDKTLNQVVKEAAKLNNTRLSKYLTPEEITRKIDLSDENYRFVTLIEREDGRKTFLRVFNDGIQVPSEVEISAALKRLVMRLPCVGFVSDHGSRSITGDKNRDYSHMVSEETFRNALLNQGFDVANVRLGSGKHELDSLDILVVAEPLEPFSAEELAVLYRHIDNGKNLILAGKPKTSSHMAPLMEYLGLRFEPGILVQKPKDEYPANLLLCRVAESASGISRLWESLYARTMGRYPGSIVMPEAAAIEQVEDKGYQVFPLLCTRDTMSWNEMETIDFVNEKPSLNSNIGERAGVKTTMLALERKQAGNDQRIVVLGDADCFSMGELMNNRRGISTVNGNLLMSMFNWLSYEELPLDCFHPSNIDNKLNLGMEAGATINVILKWILPIVILLTAIVVLLRRKGK